MLRTQAFEQLKRSMSVDQGAAMAAPVRLFRTYRHILIPVTLLGLWRAFKYLAQGNYRGHQLTMQWTYGLACVVAGLFTLLPQRYLGQWLWG